MLSLFIALFLPTPGALSSTRAPNLSSKILVVFHSTHVLTMNFHASPLLLKLAPYLNTLFLFRFNFHHLLQKVCLNHHVRVSGPSLCSHNMQAYSNSRTHMPLWAISPNPQKEPQRADTTSIPLVFITPNKSGSSVNMF